VIGADAISVAQKWRAIDVRAAGKIDSMCSNGDGDTQIGTWNCDDEDTAF